MKFQIVIMSLYFLLCLLSCNFRDYKSNKISSPTGKYYFTTTVNQTNQAMEDFAEVIIHLYNSAGQFKSHFNTHAGGANKWAAGWDNTKDTIILFSSDIGNSAYTIENGQLKVIQLNEELNERAKQLKKEKYKE